MLERSVRQLSGLKGDRRRSSPNFGMIAATVIVGLVGSLLVFRSNAATPSASFEAELGDRGSSSATVVTDPTASGGSAVKFDAATGGGTGGATCPAYPAFPDANCTGWQHTGVTLKRVPQDVTTAAQAGGANTGWNWTGSYLNITSANAVITGVDVNGVVYNNNDTAVGNYLSGVTVTNSLIRGTNSIDGWCLELGPGSTVTDTEIGGGANGITTPGCIGILVGNYGRTVAVSTITRVNIHHTEHGMRVDGDATVQDSYIHDFLMNDPNNHTDGIMMTAGTRMNYYHNRISHGNTSTFFVQWQTGNVNIGTMNIENNYFEGIVINGMDSSYGTYIENKGITGKITIKNNSYSPFSTWGNNGGNPILIPQPLNSAAMGTVCGNVFLGTSNLVGIDVASTNGTATQPATCN